MDEQKKSSWGPAPIFIDGVLFEWKTVQAWNFPKEDTFLNLGKSNKIPKDTLTNEPISDTITYSYKKDIK